MNDADDSTKQFIKELKKSCKKHDVRLLLSKKSVLEYEPGFYESGFFQEEPERILAVALGHPDWFEVLIHESCHMDQWLEKSAVWKNSLSCIPLDKWLKGKKVKNIDKHFDQIVALELDCEKRVVEKIKQFNLNINIEEYIQKANTHVLFYRYVKTKGKFARPGMNPCLNEAIWRHAPKYFLDSYDDSVLVLRDKFDEFEICK